MKLTVYPGAVIAVSVLATGCSATSPEALPPSANTPTTSPAPQPMAFGETHRGQQGTITVAMPRRTVALAPSPEIGRNERQNLAVFEITVTNTGDQVIPDLMFQVLATAGGRESDLIAIDGVGGGLGGDVLPGKSGIWSGAFRVPAEPTEVVLRVMINGIDPAYWVGQV